MIEIKHLSKSIGGQMILDDINFTVNQGEILGFLGPNGAGKTSTMKIITSFWTPSSGTVMIDGKDVVRDSLATRKRIGYLPEHVPLYDEMLVYEYLRFCAQVRGIPKEKQKTRIREVVNDCGLTKVLKRPVEELSKGYRQRLGLAQAIIHDPELLILDEPTTGLDPNQIIEIRELIKKIGKQKTVIFSTHILSEAQATCDRVVIINNGRITGEGSPQELMKAHAKQEILYVKIKGFRDEVLEKLKEMDNIEKVEVVDQESDRIFGYNIQPKDGLDIREQLSRVITHRGWSILEFSQKKVDLEEVFRELTK